MIVSRFIYLFILLLHQKSSIDILSAFILLQEYFSESRSNQLFMVLLTQEKTFQVMQNSWNWWATESVFINMSFNDIIVFLTG